MTKLMRVAGWIEAGRPIDDTAPGLLELRELESDGLIDLKAIYSETGWNELLVALTAEGMYEVRRLRACVK